MRSILSARLPKQKEIRKQDQIGILAQNILLCGKLRLEFFRESLFSTRGKSLSSGAMVTAAKTVQDAGARRFLGVIPSGSEAGMRDLTSDGVCVASTRVPALHAAVKFLAPVQLLYGFRKVPP